MLSYQRLDVYRCALQLVAVADRIAAEVPEEHTDLIGRLRRFAFAVPPSVVAGAAITSEPDRARHYSEAFTSAQACTAALDTLRQQRAAPEDQCDEARKLLDRMVEVLTTLSR